MLSKLTDDMLERLESQLADTIAFIATYIATADKDKDTVNGSTALHLASAAGEHEVARLLLGAGCDKDKADGDGSTALHLASSEGQLEVARILLEAGADEDKVNKSGRTALHLASAEGHAEVVRLLQGREQQVARKRRRVMASR